ncbi:hypothetical protein I203_104621 [Kwoniella mangroviensis CBS 8507]|uniref:uncharacterized protein n=1 Tax=Kwoniella mangroviensis CBS 8507 TaxID=1296122 RepID=UPI00080CDBCD|nr:uncharacterized protein I203_00433 [Kwoniella mangroviensis CBS 8507]OCF70300.1 hypothetical protein I203_00433 [Kwoniella mangroviensis CBS 8507]
MPNFLKSIFKPNPSQTYSPSPSKYAKYRENEDTRRGDGQFFERRDLLAELLRTELRSTSGSPSSPVETYDDDQNSRARGYDKDTIYDLIDTVKSESQSKSRSDEDMKRLIKALEDIEAEDHHIVKSKSKTKSKGKAKAKDTDPAYEDGRLLDPVIQIGSKAIESGEFLLKSFIGRGPNSPLLGRVIALLEAQRDELEDVNPFTGKRRYPALNTLEQIYQKVNIGLRDIRGMIEGEARDALLGLIQVLQEGPDYLIDIILITSIIHQSSIISIPFSNEIRGILDKAVDDQIDLNNFRKTGESIIAIASALDRDLLEDKECEEAYKKIGVLVKQLQLRISSSALPTPISSLPASRSTSFSTSTTTPTPLTLPSTPDLSPIPSVPSSSPSSPKFTSMTASDLQKQYGTGTGQTTPLPGLSSYQPTPQPSVPPSRRASSPNPSSGSSASQEIWEYRGQLLTASALDLVLREEMLLMADSSNQYAGEVTYDDLRKCWIPKHVRKLRPSDLTTDGEIPDTTPAGFKLKEKDEWGNKIGWYDNGSGLKEMYYLEEPKFELQDDD